MYLCISWNNYIAKCIMMRLFLVKYGCIGNMSNIICMLWNYVSHRRIIFQIADLWKRDPDWTWTGAVSSRKAPRSSGTTTAVRRHDAVNKPILVSSIIIGIIGTPLRWRNVHTSFSQPWRAGGVGIEAKNGKSQKMPVPRYLTVLNPITLQITLQSIVKVRRLRKVQPGTVSLIQVYIYFFIYLLYIIS